MIDVNIKFLNTECTVPAYQTYGAACADVPARIAEPITIPPGGYATIDTGLAVEIPNGYALLIKSRSGLAFKHRVTAFPGVIDSDYRGEVKVLLHNDGDSSFTVNNGDRIAQWFITQSIQARFRVTDELSNTARGEGGFGSTNIQ